MLIINSPVDVCLGCFHYLPIVKKAAIYVDEQESQQQSPLSVFPRVGWLGSVMY